MKLISQNIFDFTINPNCSYFPEDHARGLSTFTIMAGLGGFFGYGLGGINWDATAIGKNSKIVVIW